jgi:hypothetical protein
MSFTGVLKAVGKDFAKGLKWAMQYALPVEKLVALIFPGTAPTVSVLENATTLIQNAVVLVEQKYAASGVQEGTGAAKLAEVMTLAGDAVTALLAKAGITASSDYVQSLVSAVVALLNVQPAPAATTTK